MILYIAEYDNESYFGKQIALDLIIEDISIFDLNIIFQDYGETPTYSDLQMFEKSGKCLIKTDIDRGKLIFLINPLHSESKQIMRQILLNKIV